MSVRDELGNVCNHVVRVHFRSIGMPRVPEFTALANAQRVYGQYAICIQFASGQSLGLNPLTSITLDTIDTACNWNVSSDEQRLLQGQGTVQGVGANDITVYYVNQIRQPTGNMLAGCAGHAPGRACIVVSAIGSPWTLGHEMAHAMLGSAFRPVHSNDSTNLMFSPTASISANPPGLTDAQLRAIRASRFCTAC